MALVFIIFIFLVVYFIGYTITKKWYEKLSTKDKMKIKELDIKLSQINPDVKNKMPKKYFLYKILYNILQNFTPNEEMLFFTKTTITVDNKVNNGYLIITNKKILVESKNNQKIIPLEKIASVSTGKKVANNWVKINDSSTTIQLNNIPSKDCEKIKSEINNGIEKHKNISINLTQTTEKDISDKIARLQTLHEEGILTDYEFNVKKLELLDKMN